MTPVIFSLQANADLIALAVYIAEDDADAAHRLVERICDRCNSLGTFPQSGRVRRDYIVGGEPLRSVTVKPIVIFYRVGDEAVEVVRVVDGRRDLRTLFS